MTNDNEQVVADLVKALDHGELVFFVGAGISRGVGNQQGLPLGTQTAKTIAEELLGRPLRPSETLIQVAQEAVWRDGSRQRLEGLLARLFGNNRVGFLSAHSALASIGAPIITTNYDNLIERAYQSLGKSVFVAWKDVHTTSLGEPLLIKIHGTVDDPASCIVTEDDYYHWFDREPELRDIVRGYLLTKTLCFVGYSLADANFRAMLRVLRLKFASIRRPGVLVTHRLDSDSYDQRYVTRSLGLYVHEADATIFLQTLATRGTRAAFTDISKSESVRQNYFGTSSSGETTFAEFASNLIIDALSSTAPAQKLSMGPNILARVRSNPRLSSLLTASAPPDVVDGFARVPTGPFIAGGQRHGNELIRIELIHRPYRIAIHAVTNADYQEFVSWCRSSSHTRTHCHPDEPLDHDHAPTWLSNPYGIGAEYLTDPAYSTHPVVFVDWWDAYAYCAWRGGRLPTELEWERAARGVDGRVYPWGDEFTPDLCNTEESGLHHTTRVAAYGNGRSPCGALQMSGNVWEWCEDLYFGIDRQHTVARITKGGSFSRGSGRAECAFRNGRAPADRWCSRGFRMARDEPAS